MKLHIVLRTHDKKNVHDDWRIRYCDFDKPKLLKGCVTSLIKSINNVKNWDVELTILDDHSTKKTVTFLKELESTYSYIKVIQLEEKGYRNSGFKQYEICANSNADLIYSVEDDYLHCPDAIQNMLDSYVLFKSKLPERNVIIYPFDAPEIYDPPKGYCIVVHGSERHWRTGVFTTMVLMTTPEFIKTNFEVFGKLAANYDGNYLRKREKEERIHESNTIWNLWNDNSQSIRFNPIPSLALHMQFDTQMDPFIDWEKWWNEYTI